MFSKNSYLQFVLPLIFLFAVTGCGRPGYEVRKNPPPPAAAPTAAVPEVTSEVAKDASTDSSTETTPDKAPEADISKGVKTTDEPIAMECPDQELKPPVVSSVVPPVALLGETATKPEVATPAMQAGPTAAVAVPRNELSVNRLDNKGYEDSAKTGEKFMTSIIEVTVSGEDGKKETLKFALETPNPKGLTNKTKTIKSSKGPVSKHSYKCTSQVGGLCTHWYQQVVTAGKTPYRLEIEQRLLLRSLFVMDRAQLGWARVEKVLVTQVEQKDGKDVRHLRLDQKTAYLEKGENVVPSWGPNADDHLLGTKLTKNEAKGLSVLTESYAPKSFFDLGKQLFECKAFSVGRCPCCISLKFAKQNTPTVWTIHDLSCR